MSDLRVIPSIEQLRQRAAMRALETRNGRTALIDALRAETAALRDRLASGHVAAVGFEQDCFTGKASHPQHDDEGK